MGKHFSAGNNLKRLYHTRVLSSLRVNQGAVPRSTDTEDINIYEEFFKAIKAKVPDAPKKIVMTDDGKS